MATEQKKLGAWDRIMMAITFAEAGEHDTAKSILDPTPEKGKRPEKRTDNRTSNRPELRV
ncbi:MAG: hypothetical protein ACOY32_00760 [Thermodesulfobacteriota bacterium]